MTTRRIVGVIVAGVSALIAGVLVFTYAARADQRALEEFSPTPVLVVTQPIPAGTAAEDIADFVAVKEIPGNTVLPDRVTTLADLEGQVAIAPLVQGEQLLSARFAPPEQLEVPDFEVPAGMHQVSIQLDPRRILGGHVKAGDTVGFFVTIDEVVYEDSEDGEPEVLVMDGGTHLVLHKVLVTRVVGGVEPITTEEGEETTSEASGSILVTLAVSAADAEKVVYAAENQRIWLSLEPSDAPEDGTRVVDRENVHS